MSCIKLERERIDFASKYRKILHPEQVIKFSLEFNNPVVAWSGGKCSTLLLYLVRQHEPNIKVVFNNTGVEDIRTLNFIKELEYKWDLNLTITKPKINFWKIVELFGFPPESRSHGGRRSPKCCVYLKEYPMKEFIRENNIDLMFSGIRVGENRARMLTIAQKGQIYYSKSWRCFRSHPIAFLTFLEVDLLYKKYNIPLNPLYKENERIRSGCIVCTGYTGWKTVMSQEYPKLYNYICKLRGEI